MLEFNNRNFPGGPKELPMMPSQTLRLVGKLWSVNVHCGSFTRANRNNETANTDGTVSC